MLITYAKLFNAALFKLVNDGKWAKCTIGNYLSKLWYSYCIQYDTTI